MLFLISGTQGASGTAVLGDISEFPPHPLELWGQIVCSLLAQPKCMLKEEISGYLNAKVVMMTSSLNAIGFSKKFNFKIFYLRYSKGRVLEYST